MHIKFQRDAQSKYEYGCDLRRLYPWSGVVDPLWGGAIASVRPNESTTLHSHDEHETFLVLSGHAEIAVDHEVEEISQGDLIYLPPNSEHTVKNMSTDGTFDFLTIYWGSPEANERMLEMADQLRGEK